MNSRKSKGINVEKNNNRFKRLKKIIKKRKKERKMKTCTELQKFNVETEVYNSNKKCD